MEYLYMIQQALVWLLTIFWGYQLIISICSLVKLKDKPILEEKTNRFMAIIPAHNEENVIEALIQSLNNQDYPKDHYDIYVIADNCTDRTAEIAKNCGAIVMERHDEEHKTKGYALQWFLKQKIGSYTFRLIDAIFIYLPGILIICFIILCYILL